MEVEAYHPLCGFDLEDDLWPVVLKSNRAFMSKELSGKWSHTLHISVLRQEQSLQLHTEQVTEMSWVKPIPSFSGKKLFFQGPSARENISSSCFIKLCEILHQPYLQYLKRTSLEHFSSFSLTMPSSTELVPQQLK